MVKIEGLFQFQTSMNSDMEFYDTLKFVNEDYRAYLLEKVGSAFNHICLHVLASAQIYPTTPEQVKTDNIEHDLLELNGKKVRITVEAIDKVMSEEPQPYYSNLHSSVGIKEPEKKIPNVTIRTFTEVWTEKGWRYIGKRYSQAPTRRIANDIQLFVAGKPLQHVQVVDTKIE